MRILLNRLVRADRDESRAPAATGWPSGLRRRQAPNTWTDEFRYLLQDLAGHYAPFPGGINGVEYPEVDLVVHLAAHAKVHQLVRQPHRALENAVMTFNVLEYAAARSDRVLVQPRGLRRRAPVRGVRRGRRRLRLHGEHVLRLEDRGGGVHLLVRALLRAALSRLPLLQRLRPLRQRPAPDGARDPALHPLDAARRADHRLRGPGQDARLHVRRRLRRRNHTRSRRSRRAASSTRRSISPTVGGTRSFIAPSGSQPSSAPSRR